MMPPPLRDPKTLPQWLELDYFRRPRRLRALRPWLTGALLVKCVLLVLLTLGPKKHEFYQAGPVAPAHRMFNDDCGQCHTTPFQSVRRLWPGNASARSVSAAACTRCHEGSLHQPEQAHEPSCASCHQEHRGQQALSQVADAHCTTCHAHLHRKDGRTPHFLNVSGFTQDHPEFALWREAEPKDPGALRFNHQLHLPASGVLGAKGQKVKLDCLSCHQPDGERRYMLPIQYEQHCASCHPLSVQVLGTESDEKTRAAAEHFRREPAPHRSPDVVRATLRDRFTQFFQQHAPFAEPPPAEPERPLPGRSRSQPLLEDEGAWVKHQLNVAQQLLFVGAGGCRFCHVVKDPGQPRQLPEYEPTELRSRWFEHSVFSHDSHRQLSCSSCHGHVAESRQTRDVLLPRSAACHQCHNPQVGVRAQCVDCHRYHDRAQERCWSGRLSIEDCLQKR